MDGEILTMPQTKIYPATATEKPPQRRPEENQQSKVVPSPTTLPVFEQLQNFEKIAKQTKVEALKLKSEGDIKGALEKLHEYKRMQVELTQKRKERIAELRLRLANKQEKNNISGPATIESPKVEGE